VEVIVFPLSMWHTVEPLQRTSHEHPAWYDPFCTGLECLPVITDKACAAFRLAL